MVKNFNEINHLKNQLFADWQAIAGGRHLVGRGQQTLLAAPMSGFFASRQCPGIAIRAAMDWAVAQAKARQVVVSGFHSSLEQSVLDVLLASRAPTVIVLARDATSARFPLAWRGALEQGTLAVVSATAGAPRLTAELAAQRNELVAGLARCCVVAHAAQGGMLASQVSQWQSAGRLVEWLAPVP